MTLIETSGKIFETLSKKFGESPVSRAYIREVLNAYHEVIRDELRQGNDYRVNGLGTFMQRTRAKRNGTNPRTGEPIVCAEKNTVKFRPAPSFVESLNK